MVARGDSVGAKGSRRMNWAVVIGGVLTLGVGCHRDPNQTKLQYMPDMADGPTVKAQEGFLNPPEGSVATNALVYPTTVDEADRSLQIPSGFDTPEALAGGATQFDRFCRPCHGVEAKGTGAASDKLPRPPDILSGEYLTRGPGFFFYTITFGSRAKVMPGYGHALSAAERWQIVAYLKSLQKGG